MAIERKESNDLEQFAAAEDNFNSDDEDSDAERVLGHSDDNMYDDNMDMDEEEEDESHVQVDDDYKPPYRVKVLNREQLIRKFSTSGGGGSAANSDTRKDDRENSNDITYAAGDEKPWVCKNCNRNYKWKNSLKCHLKNECGLPPKYFCARDCGYKTNVHSNLKRHLNSKFCKSRDQPGDCIDLPGAPVVAIKEEPL